MTSPPWSMNQLKRLGNCIRDGIEPGPSLPSYGEVMLYYNDVAADTQERIQELDWSSLLDERPYEVTSRPKTIDTLRQKLQRSHDTPLPNIQDIAGVRFEAEMSLDEQDAVANAIAGCFQQDLPTCLRDLRISPHSGYRAVHLWLRLPARVEVQIRTHLQSSWANMYESLADVLGREIRYGEVPSDAKMLRIVEDLQALSLDRIASLETIRNKLLPLQALASDAWLRVEGQVPGSEAETQLRAYAQSQQDNFENLVQVVRDAETAMKVAMDTLKSSFDSIRDTRR